MAYGNTLLVLLGVLTLCTSALALKPDPFSRPLRSFLLSPDTATYYSQISVPSQPRRYLLAYCLYGRVFHQILCMREYLLMARALNRTLIIPTSGVAMASANTKAYEFTWRTALDINRLAGCMRLQHGADAVISLDDYISATETAPVTVGHFECLRMNPDGSEGSAVEACHGSPTASGEFQRLHQGKLILPSAADISLSAVAQGPRLTYADVVYALKAVRDDVITLGELFNVGVKAADMPLLQFDVACANPWRPHAAITRFVNGVVGGVLGRKFAAVHLRREDFKIPDGLVDGPEYHPIVTAGDAMRQRLERKGLKSLYVATNMKPDEMVLYKAGLQGVQVLTLDDILKHSDPWLTSQSWAKAALNLETSEGGIGLVLSLIEKYICVRATQFYGSKGAIFSTEISAFIRPLEQQGKDWNAQTWRPKFLHNLLRGMQERGN